MPSVSSIGIFDSGYGGLTILSEIRSLMPEYNYIYLGDNARTPYGTRSFDVVYRFTLESVKQLFFMGCNLVILACNTASAKALRTIQQNDLPHIAPDKRVLGVIRPTTEVIGDLTRSRHVGLFGTEGTVSSLSYNIEIEKLWPDIKVTGQACPMWVPLIENGEAQSEGADYFVEKYCKDINMHKGIFVDIMPFDYAPDNKKEREEEPPANHGRMRTQRRIPPADGGIAPQAAHEAAGDKVRLEFTVAVPAHQVAECRFYTTEQPEKFAKNASVFLSDKVTAETITFR